MRFVVKTILALSLGLVSCAEAESSVGDRVVMLAEHENQTCVLTASGRVYCSLNTWGTGATLASDVPSDFALPAIELWEVPYVSNMEEICIGRWLACARQEFRLSCWNTYREMHHDLTNLAREKGLSPLGEVWIACGAESICLGYEDDPIACFEM